MRAYCGDVERLLRHARAQGATSVRDLDLTDLRGWLAAEGAEGHARSTVARRAAAARVFTAWAFRRGLLDADPGDRLGTPATPPPARTSPRFTMCPSPNRLRDTLTNSSRCGA